MKGDGANQSLHELYQEQAARKKRRNTLWTVAGVLLCTLFGVLFFFTLFSPA